MNEQTPGTASKATTVTGKSDPAPQSIAAPRRGVIAAIGALTAQLPLGLAAIEAKKSGKRKKRKKNKKSQQAQADATCTGPSDNAFNVSGGARVAQTFSASLSGALARVEIDIIKENGSNGDYLLTVNQVDDASVPTNDVLAVTFVANAKVPVGESTVDFVFTDPAIVRAGTQFALVLTRFDDGFVTWSDRSGDICAGRAFLSANSVGPFEFKPGFDGIFTTFVRT